MTYIATGGERIFLRSRQGAPQGPPQSGEEHPLSPDYAPGYAFLPAISADGSQVAFLATIEGQEGTQFSLFVIPIAGGEPRELGKFEQPYDLAWSPDGSHLYFIAGPYPEQQVVAVDVSSGEARNLAMGQYPAWRPAVP